MIFVTFFTPIIETSGSSTKISGPPRVPLELNRYLELTEYYGSDFSFLLLFSFVKLWITLTIAEAK